MPRRQSFLLRNTRGCSVTTVSCVGVKVEVIVIDEGMKTNGCLPFFPSGIDEFLAKFALMLSCVRHVSVSEALIQSSITLT
jgi:hypothetical protein